MHMEFYGKTVIYKQILYISFPIVCTLIDADNYE